MRYANDLLDDPVTDAGSPGFTGVDVTTAPALLGATVAAYAHNLYMDEQGLAVQRPALVTVAVAHAAGETSYPADGCAWYDLPGQEALVVARGGSTYAVNPIAGTAALIAGAGYAAGSRLRYAQVVEHLYRRRPGAGGLAWLRWTGTAWSTGDIANFRTGTVTVAMPAFSTVCAHLFRVFAAAAGTDELYCSNILPNPGAGTHGGEDDWPVANAVRVGDGEGDPIVALVSVQESLLLVLKEASVWMVDTGADQPAEWTVRRVTGLTGCVAEHGVVALGADVFFASRHGVVALGGLAQQNSLAQSAAISAPMRRALDPARVVFAARWREFVLIGVREGDADMASKFFVFNTLLRAWCGEWTAAMPALALPGGGTAPHAGWRCGCIGRPGGIEESYFFDSAGRVARWVPGEVQDRPTTGPDEQPIACELVTRAFDFGEPGNWKRLQRLEVELQDSSARSVSVSVRLDGSRTDIGLVDQVVAANGAQFPLRFPLNFKARADTRIVRHLLPLVRKRLRLAQVRVADGSTGALSLRAVKLGALPDTAPMNES